MPSESEMAVGIENLSKAGNKVDCILTHCAPNSIQDIFSRGLYEHDTLNDYLETIKQSCDFKLWFFGHYHDDEMIGRKFIMLYGMIVPLSDFLTTEERADLLRPYAPIFLGRTVPPGKAVKRLKSPVFTPSRSKTTAHHKACGLKRSAWEKQRFSLLFFIFRRFSRFFKIRKSHETKRSGTPFSAGVQELNQTGIYKNDTLNTLIGLQNRRRTLLYND